MKIALIVITCTILGIFTAFISFPSSETKTAEVAVVPLPLKIRKNILYVQSAKMRASAVYLIDDLALTARHVCDVIEGAHLSDYTGLPYRITGLIKASNPVVDLCLLRIQPWTAGQPTTMSGTRIPSGYVNEIGNNVFIAGFPGGQYYSLRVGMVYSNELITLEPLGDKVYCDMVNTPIMPGASGGGAFNAKGQLVGIISIGSSEGGGLIPANQINEFLRSLKLKQQAKINEN